MYDEGKRYAEALTAAYRRTHGVDTAIARIFNCYGPRMRPDDGRMIPAFVTQALTGQPLTISGSGRQTRSVCYVSDMVAGLLALARSTEAGPINLGNPVELSVLETARAIGELLEVDVEFAFEPAHARRPAATLPRHQPGDRTARLASAWSRCADGLADDVGLVRRADGARRGRSPAHRDRRR